MCDLQSPWLVKLNEDSYIHNTVYGLTTAQGLEHLQHKMSDTCKYCDKFCKCIMSSIAKAMKGEGFYTMQFYHKISNIYLTLTL